MLRKTADISMRAVLLLSVAFYDVAPAAASLLTVPAPLTTENQGGSPADDMADLAPILAALGGIAGRQTVDHPGKDPGKGDQGGRDVSHEGKDRGERDIRLNRVTTRKIVQDFLSIRKECGAYDETYRIDCLRQGIDMIVASLPDNSEYRDAKRILRKASSRLGRIVSTYQDPSAPKLLAPAGANPRFRKTRRYTAIRRDALPTAMAKAQQIVNEASTELLRSGENSERRYAHYQEISVAVDSTKVLLRSS